MTDLSAYRERFPAAPRQGMVGVRLRPVRRGKDVLLVRLRRRVHVQAPALRTRQEGGIMTLMAFSDPGYVECCQCGDGITVVPHCGEDWSICCEMQSTDGRYLCRACESTRRDELFFPAEAAS